MFASSFIPVIWIFSKLTIGGQGLTKACPGENLFGMVQDLVQHCSTIKIEKHDCRSIFRYPSLYAHSGVMAHVIIASALV